MLRKGKIILLCHLTLLFVGCQLGNENKEINNFQEFGNEIHQKASDVLGKPLYDKLYIQMSDTLKSWMMNDLYQVNQYGYTYLIDSIYCINSQKDKIIGVELHFLGNQTQYHSDGIVQFYGAKINGNWYFWSGGYMPVPRSLFKGHDPKKPLSYAQLHSQALDFMSGYLDANGNIRDEWFESKFKGSGWGYFKDRYKYKSTLDGHQVDSEQGYYNYLWKKGGMMNWISKFSNDSIRKQEDFIGHRLSTEEKNEIRMFITRKLMNSQFPMYRGKYKG